MASNTAIAGIARKSRAERTVQDLLESRLGPKMPLQVERLRSIDMPEPTNQPESPSMRLSPKLFALAATAALLCAGCSSMNTASLENIDRVQQQLFGDMPLPQGTRIDNSQSLVLGGGPNWTGRIVLNAQQRPTDAFTFFRDQFPANGWTGISSIKARTSILVFTKQERTITIELSEPGTLSSGTQVCITAAPKGVVSSPVNYQSSSAAGSR
jgi:hypothetical protein